MPKITRQPIFKGFAHWTVRLGVVGLFAGLTLLAVGASQSDQNTTITQTGPKNSAKQDQAITQKELEAAKALAAPFASTHPQITLTGLRCQIHRDGKVQQDIRANKGQFDEAAKLLDLNQLTVKILDGGTTTAGQLKCGRGRIWTMDLPHKGINAHDMLLQGGVRLETRDKLQLQSPEMRYNAQTAMISSNRGYVQQLPMKRAYLIGKGQRFELKLLIDKNTFEYWKSFGNPAEMYKSEKPELNP